MGRLILRFITRGNSHRRLCRNTNIRCAAAVVVQASNQIVIAGSVGPTKGSVHHFGIIRLNSNGLGDSTFGPSNGQTEVNFGVNVSVTAAAIIPDGEILVSGVGVQQMDMVLLKSNGIVDQSFGTTQASKRMRMEEMSLPLPFSRIPRAAWRWRRGGSLWFRAINFLCFRDMMVARLRRRRFIRLRRMLMSRGRCRRSLIL